MFSQSVELQGWRWIRGTHFAAALVAVVCVRRRLGPAMVAELKLVVIMMVVVVFVITVLANGLTRRGALLNALKQLLVL